ncbi:MAG TPA: DUF1294 domain-containing protein [Candidatus Thermoplasmatota archaeon]|nr:DUF1294 domain-containing protein [Candidatus Thermoplasmatota archaeon]
MDGPLWTWGLAAVGALSLVAFAVCGFDKGRARRGGARVPERALLGLALVGGSPGLALGMLAFRHKTRKPGFLLAFGLVLALQAAALWLVLR